MRTSWIISLAVDAALIIVFALLGRQTHEHGLTLAGIAQTAAPFLLALLAMASMTRYPETHLRFWPQGVMTWLGVVAFGLALRVIFGATAATPFVIVTVITLGVLLMGRRAVSRLIARPRGRGDEPTSHKL
ncbi:DUF3054 domain-containing protein [Zhihengliuella salsuginis]|uniref:DUF3054 domain-containing protein n=1 Tax=Zhihengliuella salsuginis TaxID=578222 RepID=A0ABQ3GN21_9MICC|nr:DUF3054 domain-containing protein [Zhihengliuella salsuginis]GHD12641.1 hypothetical protein GCM10008096_28210 [Zhihengliuella salsuginis]